MRCWCSKALTQGPIFNRYCIPLSAYKDISVPTHPKERLIKKKTTHTLNFRLCTKYLKMLNILGWQAGETCTLCGTHSHAGGFWRGLMQLQNPSQRAIPGNPYSPRGRRGKTGFHSHKIFGSSEKLHKGEVLVTVSFSGG